MSQTCWQCASGVVVVGSVNRRQKQSCSVFCCFLEQPAVPLAWEKTESSQYISRIVQLAFLDFWDDTSQAFYYPCCCSVPLTAYPSGIPELWISIPGGFVFKREWAWVGYRTRKPSVLKRLIYSGADRKAWYTGAERDHKCEAQVVSLRSVAWRP